MNTPDNSTTPTPVSEAITEAAENIPARASLLRLFKGQYRNAGDRHSDALFAKEYMESLEAQLDEEAKAATTLSDKLTSLRAANTALQEQVAYLKDYVVPEKDKHGKYWHDLAQERIVEVTALSAQVEELKRDGELPFGVATEKRIAIARKAKDERDIDWFDAIQNTTGKRPATRLEAIDFILNAISEGRHP